MIASMSGEIANRGLTCTAYNSSKAAVHQMCRSLAQEWGPDYGVRINTLSPGVCRYAIRFTCFPSLTLSPLPTVHSDSNDGRSTQGEARLGGNMDARSYAAAPRSCE